MIFRNGDILKDTAEALINPVNCVGVMGRGLALQFKYAFPENFKEYVAACGLGAVRPGHMFVFEIGMRTPPYYIINFPTKRHWRDKSRIGDIEVGIGALVKVISERKIRSVAIPQIGCGLGGLDWGDVQPILEAALLSLNDVDARVYEPSTSKRNCK